VSARDRAVAALLSTHTRLSPGWSLLVVLVVLSAVIGVTIWLVSPALGRQLDLLAANPRHYVNGVLRLLPERDRSRGEALARECGATLRRWLLGKLASMVITGVLTGVGLVLLGIPLALVLALLAALLGFIPNFGPILASVPAILLGLSHSPSTAAWVAGLHVVVQAVESYGITPLIQRKMVALPPALTIVAQMTLGVLVGGLGVVLATPLTALGLVLVRRLYVELIADRDDHTAEPAR